MTSETTFSISEILRRFADSVPWWAWILLGVLLLLKLVGAIWLPKLKGWLGERAVMRGLRRLDALRYVSFHDLYLPRPDGNGTTQLDHVVVSKFGVFVIETKNYKGWIFGSEKKKQWTQSIYKRKNRFQNPLHQNALHIRALSEFLALDRAKFHSVVCFIGGSTFKTEMPPNVLSHGLVSYIEGFTESRLEEQDVERIGESLRKLNAEHDRKALAKEHVKAIRARG